MTQSEDKTSTDTKPIPAKAGIGLRTPHFEEIANGKPDVAWLEIHSENFLAPGGPRILALEDIRRDYPISCHGVGLSLGSVGGLDQDHLDRLSKLFEWVQPGLISEHVSWSVVDGTYLNDLLPLPYTEESLATICQNVDQAQEHFGRQILVENPSSYVTFSHSIIPEWEFLSEIVERTDCGILLDVNNIFVSAKNHAMEIGQYIANLPADAVGEIHVAGHSAVEIKGETILIDDHGSHVSQEVWQLLDLALASIGPRPVLVEWDTDIPELDVLLDEAKKATAHLGRAKPLGEGLPHVA